MALQIECVPTLSDNYSFLAYCDQTREAAVIDAAEADPVLLRVQALDLNVTSILSTHHHLDHTAGNPDIARVTGAPIKTHISSIQRVQDASVGLREGDSVRVGDSVGRVLEVPAHTLDQIAFYFEEVPAVFCGDTLFAGGCGRIFEGTPAQMFEALHERLGTLPGDTAVYCGHEYTESNLRFAAETLPDNGAIAARLDAVQAQRKNAAADWHDATPGEMTIPSTIAEEWSTNPFLLAPSVEELARIRTLKDEW